MSSRRRHLHLVGSVSWALFGLGVVSCINTGSVVKDEGPSSSGGASTTLGGAGAQDASGGETGGVDGPGGASSTIACERDADCDDDNRCNGAERCMNAECVPGQSVCDSFDAVHCTCEENESEQCVIVGIDRDEDGFRSAACQAAPGDDCNDDDDMSYPGAAEICDGKDNDCDGRLDLDEGLKPFSWQSTIVEQEFGVLRYAIAWSPEANAYGVAWVAPFGSSGTVSDRVNFATVTPEGVVTPTFSTIRVDADQSIQRVTLEYGQGDFGLAYVVRDGAQHSIRFQRVSPFGTALVGAPTDINLGDDFPQLVHLVRPTENDWLVAWRTAMGLDRTTTVSRIRDGVIVPAEAGIDLVPADESWTSDGSGILLPWSSGDPTTYHWAAFEEGVAPIAQGPVTTSAISSAPGSRLAMAERPSESGTEVFESLTSAGWECERMEIPYLPTVDLRHIAALPQGGWVIVHGDRSGGGTGFQNLMLSQVYPDCSTSSGLVGLEPAASGTSVEVASGEAGFAVLWSSVDGLHVHLLGPNLCDAPAD